MGVKVLEVIPEDPSVRRAAAFKTPVVVKYPDSQAAQAYKRLAAKISGTRKDEPAMAGKGEGFIDRLARSLFRGG
jgi:septum site-determining protein MinD